MSKTTKEVNEKIVDLMLLHQIEETKHYIEFYQNQLHFYNKMYDSHLELEPWKIFKKKYAQWEKTKNQYFDRISDIEEMLGQELTDLDKLYESLGCYEKKDKKKKDKSN